MTNPASLAARLRKIELQSEAEQSDEPWVWVITENDDELPGELAKMEAAGTYKPGQGIVHWRIADPEPRSGPCTIHS